MSWSTFLETDDFLSYTIATSPIAEGPTTQQEWSRDDRAWRSGAMLGAFEIAPNTTTTFYFNTRSLGSALSSQVVGTRMYVTCKVGGTIP